MPGRTKERGEVGEGGGAGGSAIGYSLLAADINRGAINWPTYCRLGSLTSGIFRQHIKEFLCILHLSSLIRIVVYCIVCFSKQNLLLCYFAQNTGHARPTIDKIHKLNH